MLGDFLREKILNLHDGKSTTVHRSVLEQRKKMIQIMNKIKKITDGSCRQVGDGQTVDQNIRKNQILKKMYGTE